MTGWWLASWFITTCVAAAVTGGCSGSKVTSKASAELSRYRVQSIAVVPFLAMTTPQFQDQGDPYLSTPQSVRRSDISLGTPSADPIRPRTMTVPPYAPEKITQLFWSRLQQRAGFRTVAGAEVFKALPADARKTPESAAAAVARQLRVDAALIGEVLVYQERVGSRLGANPPAAVGFEVKVVGADGQLLWRGDYYERQRPMTEDVAGFVRRWGAFVTAEELARYGVDQLMNTFPFGSEGEY